MQPTVPSGKDTLARQSGAPRRLILSNRQSPGDVLMLPAAVRDLHRSYPGQFETDVRTSCPALWRTTFTSPRSTSKPRRSRPSSATIR